MSEFESAKRLFVEGLKFLSAERYGDAESNFRQALRLFPGRVSVITNLSAALLGQGKIAEAEEYARSSLAADENNEHGWLNLGLCLENKGDIGEAIDCYDRALGINPDLVEALSNRGNALRKSRRYEEALRDYDKALAISPDFAKGWRNRGNAFRELRRYDEALLNYDKALAIDPDYAEAWSSRGGLLVTLNRHEEALLDLDKALALKPDIPYQLGVWAHTKMHLCDWEGLDGAFRRILHGVEQGEKVCPPFPMLAMRASNAQRKKCGEIYSVDQCKSPSSFAARGGRRENGKIRLGYFSSDFQMHPVSFLTAGMFEAHDRLRFEVIGFNLHEPTNDDMERRLADAFDELLNVSTTDSETAIRLIQQKELDIAINLNGYTKNSRTEFFCRRVAPIQVNYLGFPGTMGAGFMDYIIGDEILIPEDCRKDYSEKVVYLPNSFQANDSKRQIAPPFSRKEVGLPDEGFVFCCFNNSYKLTPELYDVWLGLLGKVDGSVLWLVKGSGGQALRLKARAAALGISEDRIIFAERMPYAKHLARYQLADLALDTVPFGGGTTTSDSLWAGVPVLTCIGESFAGRMSASLLHAVGLPELVTRTIGEYESLAFDLASNAQRLSELRAKLARHRETFPLFDTALFTSHIEAAYTKMCEMNWAGMMPDHIRVDAPVV